jgi:hypothetical protein
MLARRSSSRRPTANLSGFQSWDPGLAAGRRRCRFHLFYVWLDKDRPLSASPALPAKYRRLQRRWERRYCQRARVYDGVQCHDAVRRVAADPRAGCAGLLGVYEGLPDDPQGWIKMVDIARVCLLYLKGGMYLDTDMDIGPRTFTRHQLCGSDACTLVRDEDNMVQNCFLLCPKKGNELLRRLLQVFMVNGQAADHGGDVVTTAGPLAITAAVALWPGVVVSGTLPAPREHGGPEGPPYTFTRAPMTRLGETIRGRLEAAGLPTTAPAARVRILPPKDFFPYHWRSKPDRQDAVCGAGYGCHLWDVTWAPSPDSAAFVGYGGYA